ncbi:hypothetical protein HMPREF0078_1267 [Anaerococcus vaginalis ATCC 51170]|uniref:Uncharacterized protein n=1 Tax=Anaerococcus vaginalis ATCC 51170 TaxID=655811 RepID=C7HVG6_9FIRM|nr:hypothetical protein HMPREF0078_1267 [Anaerococcus vaginalis ATCC 51170]
MGFIINFSKFIFFCVISISFKIFSNILYGIFYIFLFIIYPNFFKLIISYNFVIKKFLNLKSKKL